MATSTPVIFEAFNSAVFNGKHNLASDTLKIALVAAANAPDAAADAVLADLTEADYTYCSSRVVTVTSSTHTGDTYKLVLQDITIAASGGSVGPFRYIPVYNDTAASDDLIGMVSFASDITLADGESVTVDFDGTNGFYTNVLV